MKKRYLIILPFIALLLQGSASGCVAEDDRLDQLRVICKGKGDVVAIDDGVVACGDGTVIEIETEE